MLTLSDLTNRQKQVLRAIYSSLKDSGYPPTLADLREKLEVSSNQAVLDFLRLLEEKGFIKKEDGAARGLKILKRGFQVLGVEPVIPYVGVSAAGLYIQVLEDIKWQSAGQVEITKDILVKVRGDSMIGADIHDGDIVLVRETSEFKDGDIVLAKNDDETTIKRFIHDNGKVYLKPENPKYKNIPIYPDTRLMGKFIKVVQKGTKINLQNNIKQFSIPKMSNTSLDGVDLSFSDVREYERTKHVHRLHPYLGKFIPQLVEVFLKCFFKKGYWILDPFMGSGTTLVEANILGIHSVGIEISHFNCLVAEIKTKKYNLLTTEKEIRDILFKTKEFSQWLTQGETQMMILKDTFKRYKTDSRYLQEWLSDRALQEILFYKEQIKNYKNQDILKIILSRATRSARLIPHYDLARPQKPVREKYYCIKHRRTCEPINEAMKFINRYSWDTIERLKAFERLRTDTTMKIIQGDSREVDFSKVKGYKGGKFDGIFTSPPYVGLIDYHDQHRYAYELFGFDDNGFKEIGSASKGKSKEAREEYKKDIIAVFQNMNRFLKPKAKIFVVVNDRDNLYPEIADVCGYTIEKIFHRPVLMRTERDNTKFSESIYYFIKQS